MDQAIKTPLRSPAAGGGRLIDHSRGGRMMNPLSFTRQELDQGRFTRVTEYWLQGTFGTAADGSVALDGRELGTIETTIDGKATTATVYGVMKEDPTGKRWMHVVAEVEGPSEPQYLSVGSMGPFAPET